MKGSGQCCLEERGLRGNWRDILENLKGLHLAGVGGHLCPPPPLRVTQTEGERMAGGMMVGVEEGLSFLFLKRRVGVRWGLSSLGLFCRGEVGEQKTC